MRLKSVSVKNVRSFKGETTVYFDKIFEILIGLNGSDKINRQYLIYFPLCPHPLNDYLVSSTP